MPPSNAYSGGKRTDDAKPPTGTSAILTSQLCAPPLQPRNCFGRRATCQVFAEVTRFGLPDKVLWLTVVGNFMACQFRFILNRCNGHITHVANRITAPVSVVPMWEAWFQSCGHLSPDFVLLTFPEHIDILGTRLCNFAENNYGLEIDCDP